MTKMKTTGMFALTAVLSLIIGCGAVEEENFISSTHYADTYSGKREFVANSERMDPYKNFNFIIKTQGGHTVASCRKMSGLSASVQPVKFRAGSGSSTCDEVMPGRVSYEPISLESCITHDPEFVDWASKLTNTNDETNTSFNLKINNIPTEYGTYRINPVNGCFNYYHTQDLNIESVNSIVDKMEIFFNSIEPVR